MTVPPQPPHDAPRPTQAPPAPRATPAPDAPASAPVVSPARPYLSGIITSGLSAVSGATIASWTGVQGTLIGATIGSAVSELVRAPLDALERRIIEAGVSV